MNVRPIHFSVPMVRAIMEGRKSQTRRIGTSVAANRVEVGDLLHVREAYRLPPKFDRIGSPIKAIEHHGCTDWEYEAHLDSGQPLVGWGIARTARTMPRRLNRFVLEVTAVRAEPLQALTDEDAIAEGVVYETADPPFYYVPHLMPHSLTAVETTEGARGSYAKLWDHINGRNTPWLANPTVIVIGFLVHRHANIDKLLEENGHERA